MSASFLSLLIIGGLFYAHRYLTDNEQVRQRPQIIQKRIIVQPAAAPTLSAWPGFLSAVAVVGGTMAALLIAPLKAPSVRRSVKLDVFEKQSVEDELTRWTFGSGEQTHQRVWGDGTRGPKNASVATSDELPPSESVWSPLLGPGDSFMVANSHSPDRVFVNSGFVSGEELEDYAGIIKDDRTLFAVASGRFSTPREATEDLLRRFADNRELIPARDPSTADSIDLVPAAMDASVRTLAMVKRPLNVEGAELGEVYRAHAAYDWEAFRDAVDQQRSQLAGQPNAQRLMVLSVLIGGVCVALGFVSTWSQPKSRSKSAAVA